MPTLLTHLAEFAPRIRLRALSHRRLAASGAPASGAADPVVNYGGLFPGSNLTGAEFFRQKLFENNHVCIARRARRDVGDAPLDLETYLAMRLVVRPEGRGVATVWLRATLQKLFAA
ncbi:hypothetical protein [Pelomonas cellulosilytica]|uniref:Uncharacterized protein n=1 Tax=Pelomonas cellulosilytica TaxID=2906762 RepID=A0ABS8XYK2_9BURK|nr:hypothetical protein [Pelomonas sp. P8]MCE4557717.1 hypothetical protein [Pelomonas sp. P8]